MIEKNLFLIKNKILGNKLGFNFKEYQIELNSGWKDVEYSIFELQSEKDIFREVIFGGEDQDFNKLIHNLKNKKSIEDKIKWASFIITAQNKWTKRDQDIFDVMFEKESLNLIIQRAVIILWFLSERTAKKRINKERNRNDNVIRKNIFPISIEKKEIERSKKINLIFKEYVDKMLLLVNDILPNNIDFEIYLKYIEMKPFELKKSGICGLLKEEIEKRIEKDILFMERMKGRKQ